MARPPGAAGFSGSFVSSNAEATAEAVAAVAAAEAGLPAMMLAASTSWLSDDMEAILVSDSLL